MKKAYLCLLGVLLCPGMYARAQAPLAQAASRAMLTKATYSAVSNSVRRNIYAASRELIKPLSADMQYSLAQVSLPGHTGVLGTAWLANYKNQFYAVMPYHIGGRVGSVRELKLKTLSGDVKTILGEVVLSGNAGFHSPDMSLIKLSEAAVKENKPLPVKAMDANKPVYSFGYTTGDFELGDYFAAQRRILGQDGVGIMVDRIVYGEVPGRLINLSGACGSPLVQEGEDGLYVVGMHEGSVINSAEDLTQNLTFAVDVPRALRILFDAAGKTGEASARRLLFNGILVDKLLYTERIKTVEVVRDGEVIFTQNLRNFPHLYSDVRSELAFAEQTLREGDILRYRIQGDKHQIRVVEFPLRSLIP